MATPGELLGHTSGSTTNYYSKNPDLVSASINLSLTNNKELSKQNTLTTTKFNVVPASPKIPKSSPKKSINTSKKPEYELTFTDNLTAYMPLEEVIEILVQGEPENIEEYSEHLYKILSLLNDGKLSSTQEQSIQTKLWDLMNRVSTYTNVEFINSELHVIIEKNFDILVQLSTKRSNLFLSTQSVRFLTTVFMSLNYWQIYNLVSWKPAIAHFLAIIQLDLNDIYNDFIQQYKQYTFRKAQLSQENSLDQENPTPRRTRSTRTKRSYSESSSIYLEDSSSSESENEQKNSTNLSKYSGKNKRRMKSSSKTNTHKVIKKPEPVAQAEPQASSPTSRPSTKSSNYDPDVVHECQLTSADEPNSLCLRRFSRKYELIRHQETVHSKKKKLFKCFVCVKQNPSIGPRIFTRHDTLAKHIRVNHKISGKEAKAEVAYSKKHAEVVEEGDITVHVGRRKTKVDFELRAHMEKGRGSRDNESDGDSETFD